MKIKKVDVIDDILQCQYCFYVDKNLNVNIMGRTVRHYGERDPRGKQLIKLAKAFWVSELIKRKKEGSFNV